ncbi:MAG: hypothetical protein H7A01_18365 [Hahellaceae bacterium]|nr:hypothetical protein [Hahellaceae bacterium]MCP5213052.1 hypothetical protein [Hahellaceae bacterium]
MNKDAWKTSDSEWVKKREKDWPELEKYLAEYMSVDMYFPKEHMTTAKEFFFKGVIELKDDHSPLRGLNAIDLFLLHPSLDIDDAREIIDLCIKGGKILKGAFTVHYLIDGTCQPFIDKGVVQPDIVEVIVEAFYGKNYDEAAKLRKFDKVKDCSDTHYSLLDYCSRYLSRHRTEYFPAMQLLPFIVDSMFLLPKEGIKKCGFQFKQYAKRMKKYPERKGEYTEKQKAFFEAYMQAIRDNWDQIDPAIQEYYREPLNMP